MNNNDESFDYLKSNIKLMFKEFFDEKTNKKQRANMWTFSRLVISPIVLIIALLGFILNNTVLFIVAGLITIYGSISDFFDGRSSRKHNSYSEFGRQLDQFTDKIFSGMVGIGLIFINSKYVFVVIGEFLIALVNIGYKLKYKNLKIHSLKIGKIKTTALFISFAFGFLIVLDKFFINISNITITITFILQLITIICYIKNNDNEKKKLF